MNDAHLHLILNDIPVLGTMAGAAFILIGLIAKKDLLKLAGYCLLVVAGFAAIPTVMTGEGAEEIVESIQGIDEDIIHNHEEAAELVYPFAIIMAVAAVAALVLHKHVPKLRTSSSFAVLALAVIVAAMVAWTANLGGQIRHPEIRPGFEGDTRELKFDAE